MAKKKHPGLHHTIWSVPVDKLLDDAVRKQRRNEDRSAKADMIRVLVRRGLQHDPAKSIPATA